MKHGLYICTYCFYCFFLEIGNYLLHHYLIVTNITSEYYGFVRDYLACVIVSFEYFRLFLRCFNYHQWTIFVFYPASVNPYFGFISSIVVTKNVIILDGCLVIAGNCHYSCHQDQARYSLLAKMHSW